MRSYEEASAAGGLAVPGEEANTAGGLIVPKEEAGAAGGLTVPEEEASTAGGLIVPKEEAGRAGGLVDPEVCRDDKPASPGFLTAQQATSDAPGYNNRMKLLCNTLRARSNTACHRAICFHLARLDSEKDHARL